MTLRKLIIYTTPVTAVLLKALAKAKERMPDWVLNKLAQVKGVER